MKPRYLIPGFGGVSGWKRGNGGLHSGERRHVGVRFIPLKRAGEWAVHERELYYTLP